MFVQIVFFVPYLSLATKGVNTLDDVFSIGKTMVCPKYCEALRKTSKLALALLMLMGSCTSLYILTIQMKDIALQKVKDRTNKE